MKKLGIWIDSKQALLVSAKDRNSSIIKILSDIEDYHVKGGSGTRFKGGPQDVVQDSKYLERKKHQYKAYFEKIIPHLATVDQVMICGPAETKGKLSAYLQKNQVDLYDKVQDVLPADSMTDNQIKALIRNYFSEEKEVVTNTDFNLN